MRVCLGFNGQRCGRLVERGNRCPDHARQYEASRSGRELYGGDWPQVRKAIIDAHVAQFGYRCPGYNRFGHDSVDLTVDHGSSGRVYCRSCHAVLENERRRSARKEVTDAASA